MYNVGIDGYRLMMMMKWNRNQAGFKYAYKKSNDILLTSIG
jgi:hypothetical protein